MMMIDDVVHKRRKVHYQDQHEAECGVKSVEGEEEEEEKMQQLGLEKEVEEVGGRKVVVEESEVKTDWMENGEVGKEKKMPIDLLSALPESLRIHILSFLDMREAVKTSLLSTRWQYLWTLLPKLEFWSLCDLTKEAQNFVHSIQKALDIRERNHLEKFEVSFYYDECFASDVNGWVEFVVKHKVENVAFLLRCDDEFDFRCTMNQYMLPELMYSNSSLTHLSLRGCILSHQRAIGWGNLTKLCLEDAQLCQHLVENILSGCPMLYELHLSECWGLYRLEIDSRNLHSLVIGSWDAEVDGSLLDISAPYIHSLRILIQHEGRKLRVTNVSPLVIAKIEFSAFDGYADESVLMMSYTNELFESLRHVEKLELGPWFVEVLSMLAVKGWQLPQSDRKYLEIKTSCDEYCIAGIVSLLESSPNLQTFIINARPWSSFDADCFPDSLSGSYFQKADLKSDLLHLKTVNIRSFTNPSLAGEPMLTIMQLLLKRATVLEKMVIDLGKDYQFPVTTSSGYAKIAETLLSYPRSSTRAVVLLSQ